MDGAVRFFTYLPQTDDMTLLILKGHLLIEEQLISILKDNVCYFDALNEARLTFYQRLQIVKAMKYREENDWVWAAIKKLNTLRNELAHKLESSQVESKVSGFLGCFEWVPTVYAKDESIISRLRHALAFLCGVLNGDFVRK
jgi:hypothetical protein